MCAAGMFDRGDRQVDVASVLGVSQQAASKWHRAWLSGGREALEGAGRAGRMRKLSDEQLAEVEVELTKGPRATGFATQMWTLARVSEVIERVTGVRYSVTQTWTIMRERLRWSRQRPAPGFLGVPAENCQSLYDPAVAREVDEWLVPIAQEADDVLLVYYAGHGVLGEDDESCASRR